MLTPKRKYDEWAQPHHKAILAGFDRCAAELFVKEGPYLDRMYACERAEVISLGNRHGSRRARAGSIRTWPSRETWMKRCFRTGTVEEVEAATRSLRSRRRRPLGMVGIRPRPELMAGTPVAGNFEAYIRAAKF